MTGVEYADQLRPGASPYPSRWGPPVGETHSLERAGWVRSRVRVEEVRKLGRLSADEALERVAELRGRLSAAEALERVAELRRSP